MFVVEQDCRLSNIKVADLDPVRETRLGINHIPARTGAGQIIIGKSGETMKLAWIEPEDTE
ncbi:hypothetical protein NMD1_00494 [Novosphingobium sp. MD-1]|nr:hypothetical protein NMD1_00494 [Novosphingobium sp. MD-1]